MLAALSVWTRRLAGALRPRTVAALGGPPHPDRVRESELRRCLS